MTSNNSRKQQHKILEEMNNIEEDETLIIIATGSLIGVGFDFPRLDTLIVATPVSFNGVVEQYVGRLNRDYMEKNVIVYDYIDHHVPIFENMYHKRLKTYKPIGYVSMDGNITHHEVSNAIFDYQSYLNPFSNDLKTA